MSDPTGDCPVVADCADIMSSPFCIILVVVVVVVLAVVDKYKT
jgi:hypothetical protein